MEFGGNIGILSPGNNQKELQIKYALYEESGVKEYWIVYPVGQSLIFHLLVNGKYKPSRPFTVGDVVDSSCVEGFQMNLSELFQE